MNALRKRALSPSMVGRAALIIAATIVLVGSVAHVAKHQWIENVDSPIISLLNRFDIVNEPSLIQWYSSSLHLTCSFLLLASAYTSKNRWFAVRWLGLAVIFLIASIDEAVMIHEMMDAPTRRLLNTDGFLSIA
ncbi:MAG: hypothetical protein AAF497_13520, partial [Planctomycetota bacterium]